MNQYERGQSVENVNKSLGILVSKDRDEVPSFSVGLNLGKGQIRSLNDLANHL